MPIYTIGYGGRTISDFLFLLRHYAIEYLVDVRSMPYSRFRPDFRKKALQAHIESAGMHYLFLGDSLGGRPKDPACYVDGVLDNARVAAADFFQAGLARVITGWQQGHVLALMCAEGKPQECHRSRMLAPPLLERGVDVLHIDELGKLKTQAEVRGWF